MRSLLRSLPLLVCVSVFSAFGAAQVVKGSVPAPAGSTILLPEQGFTGGVLTGVVLGPDEQPVPNAPVSIGGAVPVELTGEVIGDERPQQPQQAQRPQPDHPLPCRPDASGKLPAGCATTLSQVGAPQDCAGALQRAQAVLQGGTPLAWYDPQGSNGEIGDIPNQPSKNSSKTTKTDSNKVGDANLSGHGSGGGEGRAFINREGGGITTDANGRFALCVRPDAKSVNVAFADGSVHSSVPVAGGFPPDPCDQPPQFYQAADKISLCHALGKPTLAQGGHTWLLPAVQAISPGGDRVLTTMRTPRDLQPGEATLSYVDPGGQQRSFTGGVFRLVSASLDRNKLRSNEGADFDYEAAFSPQWGGKQLCINVGTTGPIVLVQPPPAQLDVNGDGHASVKGKIRATQVAPGSATPFAIKLHISDCHAAAMPNPQSEASANPGPSQSPGKDPGPIQDSASRQPGPQGDTGEMKLSLTPGPIAVNPFVKQEGREVAPPPQQVAVAPPAPDLSQPKHTMDATNKYAKAPAPIAGCVLQQATGPVISAVSGGPGYRTFTQEPGLNYYTIHGCNFGTAQGHVYLIFHPDSGGPGFPTAVELYLNGPWNPNTLYVMFNPLFGGYLDEDGIILRVVTSKGAKAELPNCKYYAQRTSRVIQWMPRSQVTLGSASPSLTPVFKTTAASQTDQLIPVGNETTGPVAATVKRSVTNVGSPFTVQDDTWDFSALRPGFVVVYATPSYDHWNGEGCDQTSGHWGSHWDSATLLRVSVQGCYHGGTGYFRSSEAYYGLTIQVRGPKDALPWPTGLK